SLSTSAGPGEMLGTMCRLLLAASVLVVTVAGARAQDACLTGESTLGDQRAIATLRTSTESVCPCDTAPSRGSWRRCAKTLLESSLVAGTLRAECEKPQKAAIKNAACGTNRVPCGRVQPDGKTPISCRVRSASACTDKSKYDETACTDQ